MNLFCDTKKMIDCCAACGEEFVQNAGRYNFDNNTYCPTCWVEGNVLLNIRKGVICGSVTGDDD